MNQQTLSKCFQCGSPLILVSKITEKIEGARFPQTTSTYRCSNKECQDEKDKQKAKRMKFVKDKEVADKKRALEKLAKKNIHYKILNRS